MARIPDTNTAPKAGGALKFDDNKAPISHTPASYILGTAQVFGYGARKYAAHNYRKGFAHSRPLDAALRHVLAILGGEEIDPESGLPHVYHASCSLAMYDYMRLHYPELNDIFELTKRKDEQTCQEKKAEDCQLLLPLDYPLVTNCLSDTPELKYPALENWCNGKKPSSK